MKKIYLILAIALAANTFVYSQYVDNALKFSDNNYTGTARFVGMGGAFGAIGGDFSSIAINPAGLGIYRSSELVFSPGLGYSSNSSTYINNKVDESGYNVNLNNLGFVASYDLENSDTRWVNFNFGVGFNRINNFNNNIQFEGVNNSSLMEVFINYANATTTDPYELDGMYEFLIWDAFIMDFDTIANEFYNEITDEVFFDPDNFEINQRKIIETEGSISEFNFSFGGNYAHKLYIGASIGITKLRYDEYTSHYETETSGVPIPFIDGFDFREHSKTEGTGYTLKFGAIYKPVDYLRVGASLHLPTFYDLDQEFYNEAFGYFDTFTADGSRSPVQTYNYYLNTPLRAVGSIGFQIGKIGLIDVDYEYADYSTMKMDDDENSQGVIDDNAQIETIYQETHNLRAGAEFRSGPIYFRAGGGFSTSPYTDESINKDYQKITLSGGLGYREKNFFIDFAFSQTTSDYYLSAYTWDYNYELAKIENKLNNFILTFGFKF
ncbi:MAG: outer membrane protein transport protein [Bacteroidales bacterium]|nr:outer membrane protein transport protein [Bacteroidales bacterium]